MVTSNKKVSVIVPVYNAKHTLERTVQSIMHQELKGLELEVLLIDDGSMDGTDAVCDAIAAKYDIVRVIHTQNHGVAAARNRGLKEATGIYIVFVDADDEIQKDMIHMLYESMEKEQAQTSCCGYMGMRDGKEVESYLPQESVLKGQENIRKGMLEMELDSPTLVGACWAKMFLLTIIQKYELQFPEKTSFGEDFCFCADYYSKCETLAFVKEKQYIYNMQQGSLYYSYHDKTSEMYTYLYKKKIQFFGEQQKDIRAVKTLYMERMLCCFEYTAQGDFDKKESLRLIQLVLDNPVLKELITSGEYDVRSRYVKLLLKLYAKQNASLIYHISNIKVKIKNRR